MQITVPAVEDVNRNTPKGVHFEHSEMKDPEKNVACGTHYLRLLINRHGDTTKALEHFGTGSGYADNILKCEECLKGAKPEENQACLEKIHK